MAQVNETYSSAKPKRRVMASNAAVSVASSGLTTLLEMVNVDMTENLGVSIAVTVHDLDAFQISFKYHPSQAYMIVASAGTDFTNAVWPVLKASGDMTAQAAASNGACVLDVRGVCAVKVEASAAAAGAATVSAYAGAS